VRPHVAPAHSPVYGALGGKPNFAGASPRAFGWRESDAVHSGPGSASPHSLVPVPPHAHTRDPSRESTTTTGSNISNAQGMRLSASPRVGQPLMTASGASRDSLVDGSTAGIGPFGVPGAAHNSSSVNNGAMASPHGRRAPDARGPHPLSQVSFAHESVSGADAQQQGARRRSYGEQQYAAAYGARLGGNLAPSSPGRLPNPGNTRLSVRTSESTQDYTSSGANASLPSVAYGQAGSPRMPQDGNITPHAARKVRSAQSVSLSAVPLVQAHAHSYGDAPPQQQQSGSPDRAQRARMFVGDLQDRDGPSSDPSFDHPSASDGLNWNRYDSPRQQAEYGMGSDYPASRTPKRGIAQSAGVAHRSVHSLPQLSVEQAAAVQYSNHPGSSYVNHASPRVTAYGDQYPSSAYGGNVPRYADAPSDAHDDDDLVGMGALRVQESTFLPAQHDHEQDHEHDQQQASAARYADHHTRRSNSGHSNRSSSAGARGSSRGTDHAPSEDPSYSDEEFEVDDEDPSPVRPLL